MSTRIKGNKLALTIDAVDYWADCSSVKMSNDNADADVTTFADAASGGARTYKFEIEAIQSTDPASLWRYIWDHSGEEVTFTYAPHGNALPSTTEPHFTGTVTIGPKPEIGGEAGNTYVFSTEWEIEGTPTLDDGS